jgi:putative flavoprotein involved in K+ transport
VEREEAVVIGAGFAGLGTAAMLEKRGIPTLVLERSARVGESWRHRYDSLRLNTPRWLSTPPRYRIPRRFGRWPSRDHVIEYLEDYARELRLRIRYETEVRRIERRNGHWALSASDGDIETGTVVVATGYDHDPFVPDWLGREGFTGELIHASAYRNPEPYRGKDVLVVSAGNTGSEIAYELISNGAARVRNAMRTPPNVFPREWLGIPLNLVALTGEPGPLWMSDRIGFLLQRMIYGDLSPYGLPRSPIGFATNVKVRHVSPLIDAGFVQALKDGKIQLTAAVEAFDGPDVTLADGERIQPDLVIAATGYCRGLEPLVGHLGVLNEEGEPEHNGAPGDPRTPGLYFNGYRVRLSCQLGLMRIQAKKIAREVAMERKRAMAPIESRAPIPA